MSVPLDPFFRKPFRNDVIVASSATVFLLGIMIFVPPGDVTPLAVKVIVMLGLIALVWFLVWADWEDFQQRKDP